jgi:protein LTV1
MGRQGGKRSEKAHENVESAWAKRKDHINELGFVNDGYDYSKHLKEIGGGRFIGKDGNTQSYELPKQAAVLPDDVLPSTGELVRDLEAITISHEFMDEDLRDALFEDADDMGAFEILDDDFVAQVSTRLHSALF